MREYGSAAGQQFTSLAAFVVPFGVSCYALRMNFREEKHHLLSRLEKFQLDQARPKNRTKKLMVVFFSWGMNYLWGAFEWHLEGILS